MNGWMDECLAEKDGNRFGLQTLASKPSAASSGVETELNTSGHHCANAFIANYEVNVMMIVDCSGHCDIEHDKI